VNKPWIVEGKSAYSDKVWEEARFETEYEAIQYAVKLNFVAPECPDYSVREEGSDKKCTPVVWEPVY
jgi:hypothetical protein